MKKLFCVVFVNFTGEVDEPHIFHVRAEDAQSAESIVMEEIIIGNWIGFDSVEDVVDVFDIFSTEVEENDIIEL